MNHCKHCGHENSHCDFCGKLLTAEDAGVKMYHQYDPSGPAEFIHCKECEKKYYPGPWFVELGTCEGYWYIQNAETGKRKKIGKVQLKGINYYERAKEECGRRNLALARGNT